MRHSNVLFLCTGNSARSIMAEGILNHKGAPDFTAYSAGSHPSGAVRPEAMQQLEKMGISVTCARSKSWDEFAVQGAPRMDFIFTVCDNASHETCPLWPGRPASAHWGVPDPAAVRGTQEEIAQAFAKAYAALELRIDSFLRLPFAELDPAALRSEIERIGEL